MMWYKVFVFELWYRFHRWDTYILFTVLLLFSTVAFNFIYEGQDLGEVKENAPYVIANTMAISSAFFMIVVSAIMGVPILRDYNHKTASLIFSTPLLSKDYLLGRFLGSFLILIVIFSGLIWGMMLGELAPWRVAENLLPFAPWAYLQPFLTIVLPTLFLGSSLFFIGGALTRNLLMVYVQGILFFVLFLFSQNMENGWLSSVLDPFAFTAIGDLVRSWSVAERNTRLVPMAEVLLHNRLLWLLVSGAVLGFGLPRFKTFAAKRRTKPQQGVIAEAPASVLLEVPFIIPGHGALAALIQLWELAGFYFRSLLQETAFRAIVIIGVLVVIINSIGLASPFGVMNYPTTYLVVEELQEMSIYFFLLIVVFFSGELIWKERGLKMDLIYDATPVSNSMSVLAKYLGLSWAYVILLLGMLGAGIGFQAWSGYYQFAPYVYWVGFFGELLPFLLLFTLVSFFIHVVVNAKFIGHLVSVLFFVGVVAIDVFGLSHPLWSFGGYDLAPYSAMNAYGHFMEAYLIGLVYWLAFGVLLFLIMALFVVRGSALGGYRIRMAVKGLSKFWRISFGVAFLLFSLLGGVIYYNTNVLNSYYTPGEQNAFRAAYEQALKTYEYLPQPKIVAIDLAVDLYPTTRSYLAEGTYTMVNRSEEPIPTIHLQHLINDDIKLSGVNFSTPATLDSTYVRFAYQQYRLEQALSPGDTLLMSFKQAYTPQGFSADNADYDVVQNGTFFNNDHFPSLAYNRNYELQDTDDRKRLGLPIRRNKAHIDDPRERRVGRTGGDGSEIDFSITLSTGKDQIALAPGDLLGQWEVEGRAYFHYRSPIPMINFYSIVSARYAVKKDRWIPENGTLAPVELEIYYHEGHEYNLDRMMEGMKASLTYYSEVFGPYQYDHLRIMEFPRYREFAQSFPGAIPYSEAIGFIMDIDEEHDIDMPFFITAHEVAHQWWGMQVVAANVAGKHMILEALAQYSAIQVLKEHYGAAKTQQFLAQEYQAYLEGRGEDGNEEPPLALVENQEYVYYRKGGLNLHALQARISADSMHLALRNFLTDWNFQNGTLQQDRYPTSMDLIGYFREVTPDSLQYLVTELFEEVGRVGE